MPHIWHVYPLRSKTVARVSFVMLRLNAGSRLAEINRYWPGFESLESLCNGTRQPVMAPRQILWAASEPVTMNYERF